MLKEILICKGEDGVIPHLKEQFDSLPTNDRTKYRIQKVLCEIIAATVNVISDDPDNQMKIVQDVIFGETLSKHIKGEKKIAPPFLRTILKS